MLKICRVRWAAGDVRWYELGGGDAIRALQRQNLLGGVHNCRIRSNWAPQDIVGIGEVDDDDLILLIDFFTDANEVIALECQCLHKSVFQNTTRCAALRMTNLERDRRRLYADT